MCSNQKCELGHDVVFSLRRMDISATYKNQGFRIERLLGTRMWSQTHVPQALIINYQKGLGDLNQTHSFLELSKGIGESLKGLGWRIGTAESCTGGLLAAAITDVPGSSRWFDEGLVTYSNQSKQKYLAVPSATIEQYGAVSSEVVEAMVRGVLANGADVAVATSGIAGPDGGSVDKPVGTVWMAWAFAGDIEAEVRCFEGNRQEVRYLASEHVLSRLSEKLRSL